MSKHNRGGFVAFAEHLKSTLGTLSDDQQERLQQKARQTYGLTTKETVQIFEDLRIKVINYFETLELTIEELENDISEETVKKRVQDAWFPLYEEALKDHTSRGVDRRDLLNKAKNNLIDPQKRREHIGTLTQGSELTKMEVFLDVNTKDADGNTPLHLAAQEGDHKKVEALLKNGADVDAKGKNGNTPLHIATHKRCAQSVKVLLKSGADVNAKSNLDWTPLHLAAWNNAFDTAEILLKNGANINAKNKYGETPLKIASNENASETEAVLHNELILSKTYKYS